MPASRNRGFSSRRSNSAASEPTAQVSHSRSRGNSARSRTRTTRRSTASGNSRTNRQATVRRRRQALEDNTDGYVNRRNSLRDTTDANGGRLPTSRESLDILRSYLIECERNLIECQQQRDQLAQMVTQIIEPEGTQIIEADRLNDLNLQSAELRLADQYHQASFNAGDTQVLPTPELLDLLSSVTFVAEERGEQPVDTLNELMRRRTNASEVEVEQAQHQDQDQDPLATSSASNAAVDIVVHAVSQVNGNLAFVLGLAGDEDAEGEDDDERAAMLANSENGARDV
ncbi:hypothetical protein KR222_004032 [Zaprionus bogoriensis]|nr:hypothetical protein KR222_004032 [Zaprionus bogoriensis]